MYCSEYLWKYMEKREEIPGTNAAMEQGALMADMIENGDTTIISDTTGKTMVEGQAQSVYGRNMDELLAAYHAGDKSEFAKIVTDQLLADDEVEVGKHA